MNEAYIVAALRTAGGKKGGRLKDWHPADLGGFMIDALLDRGPVDPQLIEDAIFGCVNQVAEQAANIGRQSVLPSIGWGIAATCERGSRGGPARGLGRFALDGNAAPGVTVFARLRGGAGGRLPRFASGASGRNSGARGGRRDEP